MRKTYLSQQLSLLRVAMASAMGHSFLLSSGYTTDSGIADHCTLGMSQTEDGCKDLDHHVDVLCPGVANALLRSTRLHRKSEGLFNCQGREMHIIFGAVLNIATIMFRKFLRRKGVVMDFALYRVVLLPLIRKCLEECTAAGTRPPQDNYKLNMHRCQSDFKVEHHVRIISPGRTTPSNPERISLSGGWRPVRILFTIFNGLSVEPRVSW